MDCTPASVQVVEKAHTIPKVRASPLPPAGSLESMPRKVVECSPLADVAGPAIESIGMPPEGTYAANATLTFRVVFDEPVTVTGTPTLPVEIGLAVQQAELAGDPRGGDSRSLVFETKVAPNASDRDGITLGTVGVRDGVVVRLLGGSGGIKDRAGNAASPVIPTTANSNAKRILVDAVGPGVTGYGFEGLPAGTIKAGGRITVEVHFDGPVTVAGTPTIPFSIGDSPQTLTYDGGSGTRTLRFTHRATTDVAAREVAFRRGLGEVIHLPDAKDSIRDRLGNEAGLVRGTSGDVLVADGARVVVLGSHYQFLSTVKIDALNRTLNVEAKQFVDESGPPASYVVPTYEQATHDVNLYKVTYNSTIPEQGNRPTVATGLVAIPVPKPSESAGSGAIPRPVVSYQHGTVYGLHEVPSYSFTFDRSSPHYLSSYETRLAVAQFAGRGSVVIAADYFGMGDSAETDSYAVKASEQQACLDLLRESAGLIRSQGVAVGKLLLSGWSQGGLVTMAFLQKLEQEGIAVAGASTASAPSDVLAATTAMLFHHRGPSDTTPDAAWLDTIFIIGAFSYGQYYGVPHLALEFFNPQYYDASRRVYMREYDHMGFDTSTLELLVYRTPSDADPARIPSDLTKLIRPEYLDPRSVAPADPRFYPFSRLAGLFRDASAYQWVIASPVLLNYGTHDEAFSPDVALIPYNYQRAINRDNPITPMPVASGNHRGTFLTAVNNQRYWFNLLLGLNPGPRPDGF